MDPDDLSRAIDLLAADPDQIAGEQERLGRVLVALKVPGIEIEEAEDVVRLRDESPRMRRERLWREGYVAAVLGEVIRAHWLTPEDGVAWMEGWSSFQADFENFEQPIGEKASA